MSLKSIVAGFLDKIVATRFRQDESGRVLFFPWGFGTGRIVPDGAVETALRSATRRMMVSLFCVLIPALAVLQVWFRFEGLGYVAYVLACASIGIAAQIELAWRSRHLARSRERRSYTEAMYASLDGFGRKFLLFGLLASLAFSCTACAILLLGPVDFGADPIAMALCLALFLPLTGLYASALARRRVPSPAVTNGERHRGE